MRVIYEPTGRALEYSLLALNPWGRSWCSHDCDYCYVPSMYRMSRAQWEAQPFQPRKDLIKQLRRDCLELAGTDKRVLCCFAGDLYSPEAAKTGISRQILETFREFDVPFQVLTKGGTRAVADFDLYGRHDAFATTLVFRDPDDSAAHEPGAAWPSDRIEAIRRAHRRGIETWVSLEPVLDPEQSLAIIEQTQGFVDLFKVGKWNHAAEAARIDWRGFGMEALALLKRLRKPYYIKDDLAKHLEGVKFTNTDTRRIVRRGK